jgi:hypothetical protein
VAEAFGFWPGFREVAEPEVKRLVLVHPQRVKAIASAKLKNDRVGWCGGCGSRRAKRRAAGSRGKHRATNRSLSASPQKIPVDSYAFFHRRMRSYFCRMQHSA